MKNDTTEYSQKTSQILQIQYLSHYTDQKFLSTFLDAGPWPIYYKCMLQDGLHKNVLKAKSLERLHWHICIKHYNYHVEVRPDFDPSCQIPNYDIPVMSSREENSWIKWMRFKYKHFIFMALKLKTLQDELVDYLKHHSIW